MSSNEANLRASLGDAELAEFIADWELEIHAGYTESILEELTERFGDFLGAHLPPGEEEAHLRILKRHTEAFLSIERRTEESWTEPTVNDRITAAFALLESREIVARENLGLTIQDGWAYAVLGARATDRGAVFFHQQDVLDAVDGHGLLLAFGALDDTSEEKNAEHSARLADDTVAVLEAFGVDASWSGSLRARIRISPFEWKKRRWTPSPKVTPKRRSGFFAELFRPRRELHEGPPPELAQRQRAIEQGFVQDVVAVRAERGFHRDLAARMRQAWLMVGGERGQIGHVGPPHAFVRAGERTKLAPQSAFENIREEAMPIRARARAALAGR